MKLVELGLLVGCAGVAILVVWGTLARNSWGVNLGRVACPRCLRRIPSPGGVAGLRQKLLGGGQCAECKTLVNKWGREIMPSHKDRLKAQKAGRG